MDTNAAVSSRHGVSDEKIAAVSAFRTSGLFSPAEQAALALAEEMTQTPVHITDDLFAEVQRRFFTPQLVELVVMIAVENYRARFNRAFAAESQGFYRGSGLGPCWGSPTVGLLFSDRHSVLRLGDGGALRAAKMPLDARCSARCGPRKCLLMPDARRAAVGARPGAGELWQNLSSRRHLQHA